MKKLFSRFIIGLFFSIGFVVFLIIGVIAVYDYAIDFGEGEGVVGLDDVYIPNSPWVIQNRAMGSAAPLGGGAWLNVYAKNTHTSERVLLLTLSEIQTPIKETFEKPDRLLIILPNNADGIRKHQNSFDNIKIVYNTN